MNSSVATRATEVVLPGPVEPDGLRLRVSDLPAPAEGQVLLRMDATGVSFACLSGPLPREGHPERRNGQKG